MLFIKLINLSLYTKPVWYVLIDILVMENICYYQLKLDFNKTLQSVSSLWSVFLWNIFFIVCLFVVLYFEDALIAYLSDQINSQLFCTVRL